MQKNTLERLSYILLMLWTLLPAFMSVIAFVEAIINPLNYPNTSKYEMPISRYYDLQNIYVTFFAIFGVMTVIFAIYALITYRKRLCSKEFLKKYPWAYFMLMMLGWTCICTILSDYPLNSFTGRKYSYNGLVSIFVFSAIYVCGSMAYHSKYKKRLLISFCSVIAYLSSLILIQATTDSFIDRCFPPDYATVFIHHNHMGYVLCMGIIGDAILFLFSERKVHKFIFGIFELISLTALLVNDTFGSYLAVLLAMPVMYLAYFLKVRKFKMSDLIPGGIFAITFVLSSCGLILDTEPINQKLIRFVHDAYAFITGSKNSNKAGTGRGYLWKETFRRMLKRPIFGYGPAGFYKDNAMIWCGRPDAPHNEFLQRGAFTGIPGLIMYLCALFSFAWHHFKNIRKLDPMVIATSSVTLTYLISSCFGNPIFSTAIYFYLFLGLSMSWNEEALPIIYDENPEKHSKQLNIKKSTLITCGIILVLGMAGIASIHYVNAEKNEYSAEMMDVTAMQAADACAKLALLNNEIKDGDVRWFNPNTFELIDPEKNAPEPYGEGTEYVSRYVPYDANHMDVIETYDKSKNYTGQYIQITVVNSEPVITWVSTEN